MDAIPQPVLYTVIAALCTTIGYLFKLVLGHHAEAAADWRGERARLESERASIFKRLEEIEHAITRTAILDAMRIVISPHVSMEVKESARIMLEDMKETER